MDTQDLLEKQKAILAAVKAGTLAPEDGARQLETLAAAALQEADELEAHAAARKEH